MYSVIKKKIKKEKGGKQGGTLREKRKREREGGRGGREREGKKCLAQVFGEDLEAFGSRKE